MFDPSLNGSSSQFPEHCGVEMLNWGVVIEMLDELLKDSLTS